MARYSFPVGLFHPLPYAGLPRRTARHWKSCWKSCLAGGLAQNEFRKSLSLNRLRQNCPTPWMAPFFVDGPIFPHFPISALVESVMEYALSGRRSSGL